MRKIIQVYLALLIPLYAGAVPNLTQAETNFQNNDFTTAKKQYEEILTTASGSKKYQAQLRVAACQYHLGEFLNAAKTLYGYELPQDPLWKARFLLYRTFVFQNAASQFSRILNENPIDTPQASQDITTWTQQQWQEQIAQDFRQLWSLKNTLLQAPIEQENLILTLKDTDIRRIPTLFDFTVQQWINSLNHQNNDTVTAPLTGIDKPIFLNKTVRLKKGGREAALTLQAQLLEQAFSLSGKNRQNAIVFWKTDFILFPFTNSADFIWENKEKSVTLATNLLQELGGFSAKTSPAWLNRLKRYWSSDNTSYARGYTALETAHFLQNQQRQADALQICQDAQQLEPSYFTQECANLAAQLQQVQLHLEVPQGAIHPQSPVLQYSGKNLHHIYVKIYASSFEQLSKIYARHNPKNKPNNWGSVFSSLREEDYLQFLNEKPLHEQTFPIAYQSVAKEQTGTLSLTALPVGIYVVLSCPEADFNRKTTPVQAVVLNVTDLTVFATSAIEANPADFTALRSAPQKTLHPNVFHLYTVDLKTGQPAAQVPLDLLTSWQGAREQTQTDKNGQVALPRAVTVGNQNRSSNYQISALGKKDHSVAYIQPIHFYFYNPDPVLLSAQTDRPIYRPGQKVYLSVQALERQVRGWKTLSGKKIKFTVRDPNWKTIFTSTQPLNEMGSAQAQFSLPQEGVLGHYYLETELPDGKRTYQTGRSFRVEEFKRPDYEVTLLSPVQALEYGKPARLEGQANYYFGAPLANAKVNYSIKRQEYHPPFYWWWTRWMPVQEELVLQGETTTNDKGQFFVSFTPSKVQEDEEFSQFVVQAEVFDESGRPIETTRSYQLSAHPHLFKIDFSQGFYDARTATELAQLDLTNADGNSVTGKVQVKVHLLENKLPPAVQSSCRNFPCSRQPSLEAYYQDFATTKTAFEKTLYFNEPGPQRISLPALEEGVYRLTVSSPKAATQSLVFVVTQTKSALKLPAITLTQRDTYYPGETMRVLLGAAELQGSKQVEIYQQNNFVIHKQKLDSGVTVLEFPIQDTHRGGLAVRWFGVSNYQFYDGETSVDVPFDNKKLTVDMHLPESVKPGSSVHWTLTARSASDTPVNGQALVTIYDKSLDYYEKNNLSLDFSQLFSQQKDVPSYTKSNRAGFTHSVRTPALNRKHAFNQLPLPSFNLHMFVRGYGLHRMLGSRAAMPMMAKAAGVQDNKMITTNAMEESAAMAESASFSADALESVQESEADTGSTDQTTVRTDFAETAYFNSAVPVTNGKASLRFTLPQSLTAWNILGYVLTPAADFGSFMAQTVTRKDLMIRLTLPRFYREDDRGTLQAAVTNQTNQKLTAQVTLQLTRNGQNVLPDWHILQPVKTVSVEAQSTQFVTWEIQAPNQPDLYTVLAIVRAGKENDAEQRELPVLPAKQRLLASVHTALKEGTNSLNLREIANIPSQDIELTSLSLHPSLALQVLNSMPNLLTTTHKDLVSTLNRYVPLAVVHQFYTTYPELKQAVQKLPKRTGLTASWNENDPLRLELLAQTPWLRQAQGRQVHNADIISLFDNKLVASYLEKELKNILKFQNPTGAFTWFAGGPDDEYLTLYALHAFSQALTYQAEIPQAAAQKAFEFIHPKIEARLKKDSKESVPSVAYALYAAYTLSAFPKTWPSYNAAKPYIKRWVDYADEYAKFMTPLGQIYAAAIYHRLGDDVKANKYLNLVLSRLKEDPLTGAYFAPEPESWLWYNDTLTTQTVTLRTLLEIRPQAPQLDAMTQWLLFNRQVNDWTDTQAAAQAVFTLLDIMKIKGALSTPSGYQINWGNTRQNLSFQPMDWTENLQWVHSGRQITSTDIEATIRKQGKMTDFASLSAIYQSNKVTASPQGVIHLTRQYFRRVKEANKTKLIPLADLEHVQIGDEIEVHLTLHTRSAFEYVQVTDPKPAGFESSELVSSWEWNPVSFYREIRDASTNFFINWLPNGTLTLRYVLRPTVAGDFHAAAAQTQSMYAPQYGAHTETLQIKVQK